MFKLIGKEIFSISNGLAKCEIIINACSNFEYKYLLFVNGKKLVKFKESQLKAVKTWIFDYNKNPYRIVLGKLSSYFA